MLFTSSERIPKHTKAKPIIIEIIADENIGQIISSRPKSINNNPAIFSLATISPPYCNDYEYE